MRIDKFLSELGVASRKAAAQLAKQGRLTVNGQTIKDSSHHINPEVDTVAADGRTLEYKKHLYILLNKPEGYVSATEDRNLPVVTELLPSDIQKRGLFPVGRLDRDSVGVMILTNDGDLAHKLLTPKHHVQKVYFFRCAEPLSPDAEAAFESGITLKDGYLCKSARISVSDDRLSGEITLTEGKYHQIKRMIASFNNKVTYLERKSFARIPIQPLPERGHWRYLSEEEIASLVSEAARANDGKES